MLRKILAGIVLILAAGLMAGCGDASAPVTDTYTVRAESTRYQGKLVSSRMEQYDFDGATREVQVTNGQRITAGTVLITLSAGGKDSLSADLRTEMDLPTVQADKAEALRELEFIRKGDFSESPALAGEYTALSDEFADLEPEIRAQQIVVETAEINYNYALQELIDNAPGNDSVPQISHWVGQDLARRRAESDPATKREMDKLTALYEKEQETNRLQLDKLNARRAEVKALLDNFLSCPDVISRIRELEAEIASYEKIEQEYGNRVSALDSDVIVARNDGLVVIEGNTLYVYSNHVEFVFTTPARNLQTFLTSGEGYGLEYNGQRVGQVAFSYYVPGEEDDTYDLVYSVSASPDVLLLTNTYAHMVSEPATYLPAAYVGQKDDGSFYVLRNGVETSVEVVYAEGRYQLLSGLKEGDEIERIH